MAAGMFEQSAGKDHITVTSLPVDNGINTRLELEEGLLKLITFFQRPTAIPGGPGGPAGMGPGGPEFTQQVPEKKNPGDKQPSPF